MIFLLNLHQRLIEIVKITSHIYISKKNTRILIYFKIDMFYFNQSLHYFSNQFFKNFILIRFT